MEHLKILNLLNEASDPKFMTRKWNVVKSQSSTNYDVGNEIIYNTEVLKSNPCNQNDTYILVRGYIITTPHTNPTLVAFKNCAPFTKYITKIDGTTIDDAEDLGLVMLIQNLMEYSLNYSEITRSLWFYSKDQATNFNLDIENNNNFKSFEYNPKLLGNTVAVLLKYLSNFWRSLEMPLINCKI